MCRVGNHSDHAVLLSHADHAVRLFHAVHAIRLFYAGLALGYVERSVLEGVH